MSISEAFDEVVASCEDQEALSNILRTMGCNVPDADGELDTAFIQPELKVIAGILLVDNKSAEASFDAKKTLREGLTRICLGKPVEGVSEAAMDRALDSNLDLL